MGMGMGMRMGMGMEFPFFTHVCDKQSLDFLPSFKLIINLAKNSTYLYN